MSKCVGDAVVVTSSGGAGDARTDKMIRSAHTERLATSKPKNVSVMNKREANGSGGRRGGMEREEKGPGGDRAGVGRGAPEDTQEAETGAWNVKRRKKSASG